MSYAGPSGLLLPRLFGALCLRPRLYREVALDTGAGIQAGIIVVVAGILEGSVDLAIHEYPDIQWILVRWALASLIGWLMWSVVLWLVGTRVFPYRADFAQVLRAVAFAHATGFLYGIGVLPLLTPWAGLLYLATLLWFVAAVYAAIRGVFDLSGRPALVVLAVALGVRVLVVEVLPYALRLIPGT